LQDTIDHYHEGLYSYRDQEWDKAAASFNAALAIIPDDGPSITMLSRCDEYKTDPPGADWNGTHSMKTK